MYPEFTIRRKWNGKPIRLTVHNWFAAQLLSACSDKELAEILSGTMILG